RQDAGAHQRGFAGTGRAVNEHEMMGAQALDHIVDHPLAAEKDRPFVNVEGTQSGIGMFRPRGRQQIRTGDRLGRRDAKAGRAWALPSQPGNLARQSSLLMSNCSIPKGDTSMGSFSPEWSSTAHGSGVSRADWMRSRSSTPISSRSPRKRSSALL